MFCGVPGGGPRCAPGVVGASADRGQGLLCSASGGEEESAEGSEVRGGDSGREGDTDEGERLIGG